FRNDVSLSLEEIERIVSWADGGAPEGDEKDLLKEIKIPEPPKLEHSKGELTASGDFALTKPFALDGLWAKKLPDKASIKIFAELPDGSVEALLWLDGYQSQFEHPFLLRTPLTLPARTIIRGIPTGAAIALVPVTKKPEPAH